MDNIKELLKEIIFLLFEKNLIIKIKLKKIIENIKKIKKEIYPELILSKFIPKLNEDIQDIICKKFYNIKNIDIIQKTKQNKKKLINTIKINSKIFYFKNPFNIVNILSKINIKNRDIINICKYDFIYNIENISIMGIINLDLENITTFSQFIFFSKTLEKYLNNKLLNIMIYPHEFIRIFENTPISTFRSLYLLYNARDSYLRIFSGKIFIYEVYINHMVKYMEKMGHYIKPLRNADNTVIFAHI